LASVLDCWTCYVILELYTIRDRCSSLRSFSKVYLLALVLDCWTCYVILELYPCSSLRSCSKVYAMERYIFFVWQRKVWNIENSDIGDSNCRERSIRERNELPRPLQYVRECILRYNKHFPFVKVLVRKNFFLYFKKTK
jgi:hypothetical protein